jgi:predicted ATP-dependent serine protease
MAVFTCRRCGHSQDELWEGKCPSCGGFYNAKKVGADSAEQKSRSTFAAAATKPKVDHVPTGVEGVDLVLSGGLVAGIVILFGGFRGTGKTTLLAMIADALSKRRKVFFSSSEQSEEAVIDIAARVGSTSDNVVVLGDQKYVEDSLARVKSERPFLTIWDSLQKYQSRLSAGVPGSAAQGSAVASAIKEDCRSSGRCAIIVNQIARSGEFKGGTDVEHDVDTLLMFAYPKDDDEDAPGDEEDGIRVLVVDKNRHGKENLKTYWKMNDAGVLEHVPARSKIVEIPRRKYTLER